MLGFMEYVQNAFYEASQWNQDNSYSSLTSTAQGLLDFETPKGLRLNVSSLASPNFATSYTVGAVGLADGSVSYLYTSLPLDAKAKSSEIALQHVVRGYRHLRELRSPDERWWWEVWHRGRRVDRRDTLLYGRMFLPQSTLEALYLRRLSPTKQLSISCVSDAALPNGGTLLALLQNDVGKYSTEYLYSTDSALFGVRGLYNFGKDPRMPTGTPPTGKIDPEYGRFSAGAELYYGALNKSGGMSTGIRFTTLPRHTGFPYTMTLTLNPLMGNLSSTYAVKAGRNVALCSRFDFNVYSYESDVQLGCEVWRRRQASDVAWAAKKLRPEWKRNPVAIQEEEEGDDVTSGVLKARVDQRWNIGMLWEARFKDLLLTLGARFDLRKRDQILKAIGVEVQYSS